MGRRYIKGLLWCKRTTKPNFKKQRQTAAQKRGITYERKIAKILREIYEPEAEVQHGPWLEFEDAKGWGICQPDVLILPTDVAKPLLLIEIKLTHKPEAEGKLRNVYKPLISKLYPTRKIRIVQVYRRGNSPHAHTDLRKLLEDHDGYTVSRWF